MTTHARPHVTLKLASSLDGKIATAKGESRWITGEQAREQVHRQRAQSDAVMIGINTALADDPMLDVRLEGHSGKQPARIVVDSRARLPLESKLVESAVGTRTILLTTNKAGDSAVELLRARNVEVVETRGKEVDLPAALECLTDLGIKTVYVEGGGTLAASLLKLGLVDALEWYRSPMLLGDEGVSAVGELKIKALKDAFSFRRVDVKPLGPDLWERYERV